MRGGSKLEQEAGNGSGVVHGLDWKGEAKNGAGDRIDREERQIRKLVDSGHEAYAKALEDGERAMEPIRATLTKDGHALENDTYDVSQNWDVKDKYDYEAGRTAMIRQGASEQAATDRMNRLMKDRENHAATEQVRLQRLADELGVASDNMKNAVAAARAEMDALAPITAGLTGAQGKSDWDKVFPEVSAFMQANPDPEALKRLVAATSLSKEDLAALARGEKIQIPAGQMAYLYQMSKSLDGLSPAQLANLQNLLPAEMKDKLAPVMQNALSQGLKIVSNPNVQVAGADQIKSYAKGATPETRGTFVPVAGSQANLPSEIAKELGRTDRVTVTDAHTFSDGLTKPGTVELKGVGAMQDIAKIFGHGEAGYSNGSEATRSMLAAASQYSNADIDQRATVAAQTDPLHFNAPNVFSDEYGHPNGSTPTPHVNGALADIVQAASSDHVGIRDLATASDGDKFLRGLLQENWGPENSGKVGQAFGWMDDDPHNPVNSSTANAVAHYLGDGDTKNALQHIPGTDGQTFGSTNPLLARAVTEGLSPYLAELSGADGHVINGVEAFGNQREMANMFSVLDQDHVSGVGINNAALAQQQGLLFDAAKSGPDHYQSVEYAERIQSAMNAGAVDARDYDQAHQQYAALQNDLSKSPELDLKKLAETAVPIIKPVGEVTDFLDKLTPSPALKTDPTTIHGDDYLTRQLESGNFNNSTVKNITALQGLIAANPTLANDPVLQERYFTGGQIDPQKVHLYSELFDTDFNRIAENKGSGYDSGSWNRNVNEGKDINWR
ncbi:Uncharacterised protein [Mycobacteroides abscessus subsp. massiliense]|uniref:TPR repeat region-containing protein n=1 Tax=Mycobacteroides abscessus TaxID=36809 RepID=UPI0009CF9CFA|nr:hypothetical protein [Mycobacteroides abscessus]SLI10624.1 Uncharacterised protein [Mycobacteroides abscessus subsp. massiliense]